MNYTMLTFVVLVASVGPVMVAAWSWGTIDWSPWLLLAGLGTGLALVGRRAIAALQLRLHRVSAAAVAGEVAPGHAPGGWFLWGAVPLWTIALGLFLNVKLDTSPGVEHPSRVVQIKSGKNKRVFLQDPRDSGGQISMHGNNPLARELREGQDVTVVVHRGFFGWAWIATIR